MMLNQSNNNEIAMIIDNHKYFHQKPYINNINGVNHIKGQYRQHYKEKLGIFQ